MYSQKLKEELCKISFKMDDLDERTGQLKQEILNIYNSLDELDKRTVYLLTNIIKINKILSGRKIKSFEEISGLNMDEMLKDSLFPKKEE